MKKIITSLLFLAGTMQAFAQVTWTTPAAVASGATYGNFHPRVAINRAGNPYIMWGKSNASAYFVRWTGAGFSSPIKPSGSLTVFSQSWAGPDMAAYGDTIYVSMKVTPEMDTTHYTYLAHSYNGGTSFSAPVRVDNIGANYSRFPIVTATSTGNPLVSFMKFDPITMGNARYVVVRSSDFGNTFSTDVLASSSSNPVCDCCPAAIVSSGSNAIMLYRDNASNIRDSWAGVSTDGGMTFPGHMNIDGHNWMFMSCPSTGPDGIIIGDTVYSVFRNSASGTALVYFSRSSISGVSLGSSVPVTGTFSGLTSQDFPRIANDGNTAAAVWIQNTSSGKYVAYSFTNNISGGFSGYSTVTGSTGSPMNADVAMMNGVIHVVWEDMGTGDVMYMKGTYPTTTSVASATRETISVYPNPAAGSFTASVVNAGTIASSYLVDMTGRRIDIQPTEVKNGKATFSTSGIAKGNYYFLLTDDAGKAFYAKIILQ